MYFPHLIHLHRWVGPVPALRPIDLVFGRFRSRPRCRPRCRRASPRAHADRQVCFPPLPLADLDWNICDLTETRRDGAVTRGVGQQKE